MTARLQSKLPRDAAHHTPAHIEGRWLTLARALWLIYFATVVVC